MSVVEDIFDGLSDGIAKSFDSISNGMVNVYAKIGGYGSEDEEGRLGVKAEGMSYIPELAGEFRQKIEERSEVTSDPYELGKYAFNKVYHETNARDRDKWYKLSRIRWVDFEDLYNAVMAPKEGTPKTKAPANASHSQEELLKKEQERLKQTLQQYGIDPHKFDAAMQAYQKGS